LRLPIIHNLFIDAFGKYPRERSRSTSSIIQNILPVENDLVKISAMERWEMILIPIPTPITIKVNRCKRFATGLLASGERD
jgi:hypothetical protein